MKYSIFFILSSNLFQVFVKKEGLFKKNIFIVNLYSFKILAQIVFFSDKIIFLFISF